MHTYKVKVSNSCHFYGKKLIYRITTNYENGQQNWKDVSKKTQVSSDLRKRCPPPAIKTKEHNTTSPTKIAVKESHSQCWGFDGWAPWAMQMGHSLTGNSTPRNSSHTGSQRNAYIAVKCSWATRWKHTRCSPAAERVQKMWLIQSRIYVALNRMKPWFLTFRGHRDKQKDPGIRGQTIYILLKPVTKQGCLQRESR